MSWKCAECEHVFAGEARPKCPNCIPDAADELQAILNEAGIKPYINTPTANTIRDAIAAAKAEAWKRAIGWVDYYLAMKLHDAARGGFEDLRKRMAHEAEHGPATSVPMDSDHLKPEAGK